MFMVLSRQTHCVVNVRTLHAVCSTMDRISRHMLFSASDCIACGFAYTLCSKIFDTPTDKLV